MNSRKFRDLLEPLRTRRAWAHDAALRRVAQLRRELDVLRANEERLASSAAEQALAAQGNWSNAPHPEAHLASVSWLAGRHAERDRAQHELTACTRRLADAIAQWEAASAALDAVDRQTQRDRSAHMRAVQVQAEATADAEWLARKESA